LALTARVAELVNREVTLKLIERPESARELDLIAAERQTLAAAPNLALVLISEVLQLAVMVAILGLLVPWLAFFPLLSVAPFLSDLMSSRHRAKVDSEVADETRTANRLFAIATDAKFGKEIRTYGMDKEILDRHWRLTQHVERRTTRAALVAFLLSSIGWLVFAAGFTLAVVVVVIRAVRGEATLGDVVLTVILLQRAQFTAAEFAQSIGKILDARRTARRVLWLEDQVQAPPSGGTLPPRRLSSDITFDRVSFAYGESETPALRDVSLTIPAGSAVAVVGENGSGKTTLVKLLLGLYAPDRGAVLLDGSNLANINLGAWRARTAATFQDFAHLELLARAAVGVGDLPRIDNEAAVLVAIDRADAQSVVDALEVGLDTELGASFAHGRDLSGGQWQRLALARGRMRDDPLLLVLDEPTASLDAETEARLFARFMDATVQARARTNAVTLLTSHRFSTVRRADLIIVLDRGQVVEFGSHDQLVAAAGVYAELFELQASSYR
jgi:ATP-binding cassette subfamily B protein